MMVEMSHCYYLVLFIVIPWLSCFLLIKFSSTKPKASAPSFPKSYPLFGSFFAIIAHKGRRVQWLSDLVLASPTASFTLHRALGYRHIFTANSTCVQHILKNNFYNYPKGNFLRQTLDDFLGTGIFNSDGSTWKFQRQVSSHEFNTKSLRNFVENVVDAELTDRLLPILSTAFQNHQVLDFEDILQRFAFDNICKIAFGFDPKYLVPGLPQSNFAVAFEHCVQISSRRVNSAVPYLWKIQKLFNIGLEKELRNSVSEVREFAKNIVREKKEELNQKASLDSVDLLSRFLSSGHSDEDFVTDIVISFILAGKDTTSAALAWFFWLIAKHPHVENEILKEINGKSEASLYDEVKEMVYTHAALCEAMRLYPPVPVGTKEAKNDDVLPDGTVIKKGDRISYHVYAMGRSENLWGADCAEFRPERWLEKASGDDTDSNSAKWRFVSKDPYMYPVFQAGPRVCLGKEMAFLQMKRVVAGVMRRFRVVPAKERVKEEPEFIAYLTSKMGGGFPVKIEQRI